VAEELGITVVPLNVHFGLETFQDGIDMQADQFYKRLLTGSVLPKTSAPAPGLFQECYQQLAGEAEGIVSIHISAKLSGTIESANTGKQQVSTKCPIEIVNSESASMGVGLLAIAAAKAAATGTGMDEIVKQTKEAVNGVYLAAALDTLEFLQKGGRVGKAQAWLGSILSIKPIISLRDGEVIPLERVRTHSKAVARVRQLLEEKLPATEIAVVYSTEMEEANKLVEYLNQLFPEQRVYLARFGPVLGTYVGPGSLAIITLK
jgi:DegV family protein with EDD domain